MRRASWSLSVASCALAAAVGCSRDVTSLTTPSGAHAPTTADGTTAANPDGSTLKATAPTPESPINSTGVMPGRPVVLVISNATALYSPGVTFSYRFEVRDAAGVLVDMAVVASGSATTTRPVPIELSGGQSYRWRARAEYESAVGPWSDDTTFFAPPPLLNGTTFLAFGDSITAGSDGATCPQFVGTGRVPFLVDARLLDAAVNLSTAYPTVLQNVLAGRYLAQTPVVTNEGRSGERAAESGAFSRLRNLLNRSAPQVLLLEEGVNDVNNFDSASEIPIVVNALRGMVREARGRGIQVLLGTLLPERAGACRGYAPGLIPPTNDQIRAMAASEGVTLVDLYQAFLGQEGMLLDTDGLHPNPAGYATMAQTFFAVIRATLESPTF